MVESNQAGPAALADWIKRESIPFSLDSPHELDSALDRLMASLGGDLRLLGLGEAMHGCEELLALRNRIFQRLVERHGFSAIALESSFPRARLVNDFIAGRGPESYEEVQDAGLSHGFGRMEGNRELVTWMRAYNAHPSHRLKLQFYGFDSPTEMTSTDSPRQLLHFVLDYLDSLTSPQVLEDRRRDRIEALIGREEDWQSFEAMMDPDRSVGRSPAATALRTETEDLMMQLLSRRPEMVAKSSRESYLEAVQHLALARQLLSYHAAMAGRSEDRIAELLGIRDAMMADCLAYAVSRERSRCGGRVFAYAHNSHLQRGQAEWLLGKNNLVWWPAGSHLQEMLGSGYAAIGSAVGACPSQGIGEPEPGSLEAHLATATGPGKLLFTRIVRELAGGPAAAALKTRRGSQKNSTYFPLTAKSLTDFDWLAFLNRCG